LESMMLTGSTLDAKKRADHTLLWDGKIKFVNMRMSWRKDKLL
jgi:hypothetical protein